MKWYWEVTIARKTAQGTALYVVRSKIGFELNEYAQNNLEAHVNQSIPDLVGWEKGDWIVNMEVVLR